jgi:hypothetical protein
VLIEWNGDPVPVRRSRGPGPVLTFERRRDNVLRGEADPWPSKTLEAQVRRFLAWKRTLGTSGT